MRGILMVGALMLAGGIATFDQAKAQMPAITGNDLDEFCGSAYSTDLPAEYFCSAYVIGATESLFLGSAIALKELEQIERDELLETLVNLTLGVCIPDGVSRNQLIDIYRDFFTDNPDLRHMQARLLVHLSILETFPCN